MTKQGRNNQQQQGGQQQGNGYNDGMNFMTPATGGGFASLNSYSSPSMFNPANNALAPALQMTPASEPTLPPAAAASPSPAPSNNNILSIPMSQRPDVPQPGKAAGNGMGGARVNTFDGGSNMQPQRVGMATPPASPQVPMRPQLNPGLMLRRSMGMTGGMPQGAGGRGFEGL